KILNVWYIPSFFHFLFSIELFFESGYSFYVPNSFISNIAGMSYQVCELNVSKRICNNIYFLAITHLVINMFLTAKTRIKIEKDLEDIEFVLHKDKEKCIEKK